MEIPGLDILDKLGEGSNGIVWKAHQLSLDRIVAIKVLKPEFSRNRAEVQAFISEARAAARLKHPNLIQVYDVAERSGLYYLVMEFIAGPTLAHVLDSEGKQNSKEALRITGAVAQVLDHAWKTANIIHRDIKPENIMIDRDKSVKLADLGLARVVDPSELTQRIQAGEIVGTPSYLSPEQATASAHIDFRTDMYSLGASLYHMVTGTVPFTDCEPLEAIRNHVDGQLPNPRDIEPSIPPGVADLIAKLMMKDPANRFESWEEVGEVIQKLSGGRSNFRIPAADMKGRSTIAPARGAQPAAVRAPQAAPQPRSPAPARPPTQIVMPPRDTLTARQKVSAGALIPKWVSIPVWTVLALLWVVYLQVQLSLPPTAQRLAPSASVPSTTVSIPGQTTTTTTGVGATTTRTFENPEVTTTTTETTRTATATTQPSVQPPSGTTPEQPPAADPPSPSDARAALYQNVGTLLLSDQSTKALQVVEQELGQAKTEADRLALAALKRIVSDVAGMNRLIEDALLANPGRETLIRYGREYRPIVVSHILNGVVHANLINKDDDPPTQKPISFKVDQMDPLDRNRLLGDSELVSRCVMNYVLYSKAGHYKSCSDIARKCGPFASFFSQYAQQKISAGSTPK